MSAKVCNGTDYNSGCCSKNHQCEINEGGCNSNDDCTGLLVCGKDNCPLNFPSDADCCTQFCEVNPCKNNGICFIGLNATYCKCPLGYEGNLCEIDSKNFVLPMHFTSFLDKTNATMACRKTGLFGKLHH